MTSKKSTASVTSLIRGEHIDRSILLIRGARVILDMDLAELYGVDTRTLLQAVKRNRERFPPDFSFQLTPEEVQNLKSQFVISSWGGRRYPPYAFTEHGVAMLSSVLRSRQAIQVNIGIMRAFMRLRETLSLHKELAGRLAVLERKIESHDESIQTLFEAIRQLMASPVKPRRSIGFSVREPRSIYRTRRCR